jgi:hypothetical protein
MGMEGIVALARREGPARKLFAQMLYENQN